MKLPKFRSIRTTVREALGSLAARSEGEAAFLSGLDRDDCPYDVDQQVRRDSWLTGWDGATEVSSMYLNHPEEMIAEEGERARKRLFKKGGGGE